MDDQKNKKRDQVDMAEDEPTVKERTTPRRRRTSDILSGVTIIITLPMLVFVWGVYRDLRTFKKGDDEALTKQFEKVQQNIESSVATERTDRKEADSRIESDVRVLRDQVQTNINTQLQIQSQKGGRYK